MSAKSFEANSPAVIQSEELFLLDIQQHNADTLDAYGVLEKARDAMYDAYFGTAETSLAYKRSAPLLDTDSGLVRPILSLENPNPFEGDLRGPAIRFPRSGSVEQGSHVSAGPVASLVEYDYDGSLVPAGNFTEEDVELAMNMICGLKDAQDYGVIPHLSSDTTRINNPNTNISARPRQPSNP